MKLRQKLGNLRYFLVVGQIMPFLSPKSACVLTPENCECVTLQGEGTADVIVLRTLRWGISLDMLVDLL